MKGLLINQMGTSLRQHMVKGRLLEYIHRFSGLSQVESQRLTAMEEACDQSLTLRMSSIKMQSMWPLIYSGMDFVPAPSRKNRLLAHEGLLRKQLIKLGRASKRSKAVNLNISIVFLV